MLISTDLQIMESKFNEIPLASLTPADALIEMYEKDLDSSKINLVVGAYRDSDGKPWVLPVVKKVELELAEEMGSALNHEYLGMCGIELFTSAAVAMILGKDNPAIKEGRAAGIQGLSGTGSLRIGADFLAKNAGFSHFYVSDPTWPNHIAVFKNAGFAHVHKYRYWDPNTKGLDFEGMTEDIRNAPEKSVIILHVCAHNPTGVDLTQDQWKVLAEIIRERNHFPFFDCAYQGFASGDLERDSWSLRYFVSLGFELFCAQSFAKNFGLYNERVGNLLMVMNDKTALANSTSQIAVNVRAMYSNPPNHGARIVSRILNDPSLFNEWMEHVKEMSSRIIKMRSLLKAKLIELKTPGSWDHVTNQIGMFCYTGLTEAQVAYMAKEHHVYVLNNGRISIAGITEMNVTRVAEAINDAVRTVCKGRPFYPLIQG